MGRWEGRLHGKHCMPQVRAVTDLPTPSRDSRKPQLCCRGKAVYFLVLVCLCHQYCIFCPHCPPYIPPTPIAFFLQAGLSLSPPRPQQRKELQLHPPPSFSAVKETRMVHQFLKMTLHPCIILFICDLAYLQGAELLLSSLSATLSSLFTM